MGRDDKPTRPGDSLVVQIECSSTLSLLTEPSRKSQPNLTVSPEEQLFGLAEKQQRVKKFNTHSRPKSGRN